LQHQPKSNAATKKIIATSTQRARRNPSLLQHQPRPNAIKEENYCNNNNKDLMQQTIENHCNINPDLMQQTIENYCNINPNLMQQIEKTIATW
jgi:hypothetical protein